MPIRPVNKAIDLLLSFYFHYQFVIPNLPIGADEGLADEFVDRYVQFFAKATGRGADWPAVIV